VARSPKYSRDLDSRRFGTEQRGKAHHAIQNPLRSRNSPGWSFKATYSSARRA
jgi:hypothetical protein